MKHAGNKFGEGKCVHGTGVERKCVQGTSVLGTFVLTILKAESNQRMKVEGDDYYI
jgi:hypothetical protein